MGTFQDFITRVRRELEEENPDNASGSTWSDESILVWTNEAVRDIGTRVGPGFDEMYADSVADQSSYSMPAHTVDVVRVSYDTTFLQRDTASQFFPHALLSTETGTPVRYCIKEDTLYLHPTPSTSGLTIRVWRHFNPTPFTSTADVNDMPWGGKYDRVISYYVKARAYEQTGDFDFVKMNDEMYFRTLDDALWEMVIEEAGDFFHEPRVVW